MRQNKSRAAAGFGAALLIGLIYVIAWPALGHAQMPGGCWGWGAAAQAGTWCPHWGGGAGRGAMMWHGRGMAWRGRPMWHGAGWWGGRWGMMGDPAYVNDAQLFHFLVYNRDSIRRTVTKQANGVSTLTESDVPAIASAIQQHVTSMYSRLKEGRPIHVRDPLFAELFRHADKIAVTSEPTEKGLRVTATSTDAEVAGLIQRRAQVIDKFLENGYAEMMTNHPGR